MAEPPAPPTHSQSCCQYLNRQTLALSHATCHSSTKKLPDIYYTSHATSRSLTRTASGPVTCHKPLAQLAHSPNCCQCYVSMTDTSPLTCYELPLAPPATCCCPLLTQQQPVVLLKLLLLHQSAVARASHQLLQPSHLPPAAGTTCTLPKLLSVTATMRFSGADPACKTPATGASGAMLVSKTLGVPVWPAFGCKSTSITALAFGGRPVAACPVAAQALLLLLLR
jgi:hypothetical protein